MHMAVQPTNNDPQDFENEEGTEFIEPKGPEQSKSIEDDQSQINVDLETKIQQAKNKKDDDNPKIFSIYIKPSCRNRLAIAKKWLGISYTETMDLLIGHLIQANVLPDEAVKELKNAGLFTEDNKYGLELLGIHGRWAEAAKLVEDVKDLNKAINSQVDELLECIEDHAEAIIMNTK